MAGSTHESPNFPATPGAYDTTPDGGDGFVAKLDPNLSSLTYSTFLGGSGFPGGTFGGHSLEVDQRGGAYVTGTGGGDLFVKRFDPTGSQVTYSTVLGGSARETSAGIALGDGARNAYVGGSTDSSEFPTTAGAYDTQHDGASDAFVAKLPLLPSNTTGCRVSGAGKIRAANGDRASFNANLRALSESVVNGRVIYMDHGPEQRFTLRSSDIDSLVCQDASATITGVATVSGESVDFTIDVVDQGTAGRLDTYRLQLSNGYDSGAQTLRAGTVKVRSR